MYISMMKLASVMNIQDGDDEVVYFQHEFCVEFINMSFKIQILRYMPTIPTYLGSTYRTILYKDTLKK